MPFPDEFSIDVSFPYKDPPEQPSVAVFALGNNPDSALKYLFGQRLLCIRTPRLTSLGCIDFQQAQADLPRRLGAVFDNGDYIAVHYTHHRGFDAIRSIARVCFRLGAMDYRKGCKQPDDEFHNSISQSETGRYPTRRSGDCVWCTGGSMSPEGAGRTCS